MEELGVGLVLLQSSGGFTLSLINAEEENYWVDGWNADCSEFSGFGLISSSRIWKDRLRWRLWSGDEAD